MDYANARPAGQVIQKREQLASWRTRSIKTGEPSQFTYRKADLSHLRLREISGKKINCQAIQAFERLLGIVAIQQDNVTPVLFRHEIGRASCRGRGYICGGCVA